MKHPSLLRNRRGFSLIELLIVVAIIAALVGVAVPFFQDNLSEAQITKAKQDLEVIKKALSLYDAREPRPLTGTALQPLVGRYMQELPKDPWGNDYLYDGAVGLLASYGADALPDGTGGDADITVFTKPPLMIQRCQYQGKWGRPRPGDDDKPARGNKFIMTMTKPLDEATPADASQEVVLLTNVTSTDVATTGLGGAVSLHSLDQGGAAPPGYTKIVSAAADGVFESAGNTAFGAGNTDPLHKPENGVITLRCAIDISKNSAAQAVTPTMAVDFANTDVLPGADIQFERNDQGGTVVSVGTALTESFYTNYEPSSPMDPNVYAGAAESAPGADDGLYSRLPRPVDLVNGVRRGVRIEKY